MKIIKTNEVENHHIFGLIVGPSGSGKTSLAKTLNHEETIIISAESGLLSVKDANIDAVEVSTFQEMLAAFKYVVESKKYKNVFVDSLTEIGQFTLDELKPEFTKKENFALYEEYSRRMKALIKGMRRQTDLNIFCTALDTTQSKDLQEITSIDLNQKSLVNRLPAFFDEVFYLAVVEKDDEKKRVLVTDHTDYIFVKDRSGLLDRYERPDLNNIINKIFQENQNGSK